MPKVQKFILDANGCITTSIPRSACTPARTIGSNRSRSHSRSSPSPGLHRTPSRTQSPRISRGETRSGTKYGIETAERRSRGRRGSCSETPESGSRNLGSDYEVADEFQIDNVQEYTSPGSYFLLGIFCSFQIVWKIFSTLFRIVYCVLHGFFPAIRILMVTFFGILLYLLFDGSISTTTKNLLPVSWTIRTCKNILSQRYDKDFLTLCEKVKNRLQAFGNDKVSFPTSSQISSLLPKSLFQTTSSLPTVKDVILSNPNYVDKALINELKLNFEELKDDFNDKIGKLKEEYAEKLNAANAVNVKNQEALAASIQASKPGQSNSISEAKLQKVIEDTIIQYQDVKAAMVDYALEHSGGSITHSSETYKVSSATVSLMGVPFWYPMNSARTVIQPHIHRGHCWPFAGSSGFVVIKLSALIVPQNVTIEHISKNLAPNRTISSAPKDFQFLGLAKESDDSGSLLGSFSYDENGRSYQTFMLDNVVPFRFVKFNVLSNYGHPRYTCLYRIRVHGQYISD